MKKLCPALALALLFPGAALLHAAPVTNGSIPVDNYSFENATGSFPDDWTEIAGNAGSVYQRGSDGVYVTAPDQNNVVEIDAYPYNSPTANSIGLHQTISSANYVPTVGDTLTLSVYVGQEQGSNLTPLNESLELTLGSNVIDSDVVVAPVTAPDLTDYSFSYTLTSADLAANPGADLGITLVATNTQAVFDDVRLSVTPGEVPEPASYVLLLAGAAALLGYRRIKIARS